MKKSIAIFVMFLIYISLWSQETVLTSEGKAVILNKDGTWKYIVISTKDNAAFRKAIWGSSKEDIKKLETNEIAHESDDAIFYKTSIWGLDCSAIYIFADNKLVRGRYYFTPDHTNKTDFIDDFKKMKSLLTEKYGDPIDDQQIWKNDLYKDDPDNWGMAVATGEMYCFANWETESTDISIQLWGDNFEIKHIIDYTSKVYGNLEDQINKEKAKDEL